MADRVLITGGAGFIGLHLTRRLLAEGFQVVILDDFSRGRQDREIADLEGSVELVRHDLTRPIPDALGERGFRVVCHLAAVVGVRRAQESPGEVLRTNVLAVSNLLDFCDRHLPEVVFFSSTSEVGDGAAYAGLAPLPTPEDTPFVLSDLSRPRSSYALSKAVGEAMLLARAGRYRARIARYYNVYGPRMGYAHVIPQFIGRIRDRVDPFPIYGAHQTRAFCYVDDAVAATVALLGLPDDAPVTMNVGNDTEEIEIIDLARLLFEMTGFRPAVDVQDPPPGSPDRRLPDLTRLRARLPHLRPTSLSVGLRAMLDWYAA